MGRHSFIHHQPVQIIARGFQLGLLYARWRELWHPERLDLLQLSRPLLSNAAAPHTQSIDGTGFKLSAQLDRRDAGSGDWALPVGSGTSSGE